NQFVEKLPFGSRFSRRLNRFQEFLDASLDVSQGATLLGRRAAWQKVMRQSSRLIGKDIADNQGLEFGQQILSDAMACHVLAENDQGLNAPVLNPLLNRR